MKDVTTRETCGSIGVAVVSKGLEADTDEIVFDVRTAWKDIHLPTLAITASLVYIAECTVYHPFDVLRTRIQTSQRVGRNFDCYNQFSNLEYALSIIP